MGTKARLTLPYLLAAVWLSVAVVKIVDPGDGEFVDAVSGLGIAGTTARFLYWGTVAVELLLAVLLVSRSYRVVGLWLGLLLSGVFLILWAATGASGKPCGCFGSSLDIPPSPYGRAMFLVLVMFACQVGIRRDPEQDRGTAGRPHLRTR